MGLVNESEGASSAIVNGTAGTAGRPCEWQAGRRLQKSGREGAGEGALPGSWQPEKRLWRPSGAGTIVRRGGRNEAVRARRGRRGGAPV